MGQVLADEWVSDKPQEVPATDFVTIGFSCKDMRKINANSKDMVGYILSILTSFDADVDHCDRRGDEKINGSTAPTLIGCLRYVASHRPSIVMLENVPKVRILLQAFVDIFHVWAITLSTLNWIPRILAYRIPAPESTCSPHGRCLLVICRQTSKARCKNALTTCGGICQAYLWSISCYR